MTYILQLLYKHGKMEIMYHILSTDTRVFKPCAAYKSGV